MNSIKSMKDIPSSSLKVTCSWDANIPDKSIHDTILLKYEKEENDDIENLNDLVTVKTTVSFIAPERANGDPPQISIIVPSQESYSVSSITVLCDSRAIEVFGDHFTYMDTAHGKAIEETDEFYVYEYKIDLEKKINKEVSLRFVKLSKSSCLWIYGILLRLKKITYNNPSTINYDNVQDLLRNTSISEQANRAFSFLRDANTCSRFPVNGEGNSRSRDSMLSSDVKQYIDYKFQILTDYLIMREKNLNDKLDHVLEILKKN